MNRSLTSLLVLILTLVMPSRALAQTCPTGHPRITVVFINGMLTSRADARSEGQDLQNEVDLEMLRRGRPTVCIDFGYEFNENEFVTNQFKQVARQFLGSEFASGLRAIQADIPNAPSWFKDAFESIATGVSESEYVVDKDLRTMVDQDAAAVASGSLILVGHSQGNFYANESWDLLGIAGVRLVAVATPASSVRDGSMRYTTLLRDFIHDIPGALPPNVDDAGCPDSLTCHFLSVTYLTLQSTRTQIVNQIISLFPKVPVAVDDKFIAPAGGVIGLAAGDNLLANDVVASGLIATVDTSQSAVPSQIAVSPNGGVAVDMRGIPGFTGALTFTYRIVSDFGISNVATVTVNVVPIPVNQPPTAGFSMTAGSQTVSDGGKLIVSSNSATGEALVTFTDHSTDAGSIVSRRWTTDTGILLSSGLSTFTWGFRPGLYNVVLTVKDDGQQSATASATVEVLRAATPTSVWPTSGHDSRRTALSDFSGPTAQPTSAAWAFPTSAPIVGDLAVSAEGRVYAAGERLYALNGDGTQYAVADLPSPSASQPSPAFLTAPAIDDANGFVYVGETSTDGGWDIVRFNKDLTARVVAVHGNQPSNSVSNLIVDGGSVFFFVGGQAYATGLVNWVSDTCTATSVIGGIATGQSWSRAPSVDRNGEVYGVCGVQLPGPVFGNALVRLDRATGATTASAFYQSGASEITFDAAGSLRVGFQAFTGGTFAGSYDRFDPELNPLGTSQVSTDWTSGRPSVLPDGLSTVRIGFGFQIDQELSARGPNVERLWDVELPRPDAFTTNPSVDQSGRLFIGALSGLFAVRSSDGGTDWSFPTTSSVTTQPAIAAGAIFFATRDGVIYCVRQPAPATGPAPTLTSISPSTLVGTIVDLTLNGQGFGATAVDQVFLPDGVTLVGQGQIKSRSATRIVVTESLAGASPLSLPYIVKVKNPDGQLSQGLPLTLNNSVSVSPGEGAIGTVFAYSGAGFTRNSNATAHVQRPDGTEFPTVQTPTSATGTFTSAIDSTGLTAGIYQTWATDGVSGKASAPAGFAVGTTLELLPYQAAGYRYQVIPLSGTPPSGFEQPTFNDSGWNLGTAAFGTCSGCPLQSTMQTPWPSSTQLLLRQTVNAPFDGSPLQIRLGVDNDVVAVFVNGSKVSGQIIHDGAAMLDDFTIQVPSTLVQQGANLIAVRVRDRGGDSYFDMRVELGAPNGPYWSVLDTGQAVNTVSIDPINPSIIYAGGSGVSKSTDGGVTWQTSIAGMVATEMSILALAIDPTNPTTIYAGYTCDLSTNCGGVYKSVDSGVTWTQANSGLSASTIRAIAVDPTSPAVVYAGNTNGEVSKSTDGGATWTVVVSSPGSQVWALAVDPFVSTTLYAGNLGSGPNALLRSTDGGATWTSVLNASVTAVAADPLNPGLIYVATSGGVFRSADRGSTSSLVLASGVQPVAVNSSNTSLVYVGSVPVGALASTDSGLNWTDLSTGLPADLRVTSIAVDPSTGIVFGATGAGVVVLVIR